MTDMIGIEDTNDTMNNSINKIIRTTGSGGLLVAALGWFVYGGLDGAFGMVIFGTLTALSILIALIPFGVGIVLQALVLFLWLIPTAFSFTGLYHTWITWLDIGIAMFVGLILNVLMTIGIYLEKA